MITAGHLFPPLLDGAFKAYRHPFRLVARYPYRADNLSGNLFVSNVRAWELNECL